MRNKFLISIIIVFFTNSLHSLEPDEILQDPNLEKRARKISSELRCMVCQNENIDSSNAKIARDLRYLVREELLAGKSDSQIIKYIHDKYGDYVLFKPPVRTYTIFLWLSPVFLLIYLFLIFFRKNKN